MHLLHLVVTVAVGLAAVSNGITTIANEIIETTTAKSNSINDAALGPHVATRELSDDDAELEERRVLEGMVVAVVGVAVGDMESREEAWRLDVCSTISMLERHVSDWSVFYAAYHCLLPSKEGSVNYWLEVYASSVNTS
ncbi:hypothetical protein PHYPSEUDO_011454 [Phytophthora pseudosyringae]|uniref:RxLR effector protein n=1 Tax=Phytophthora pseudosyringae TaxID=221518 RepID=A0A8T1W6R5_9STRA|nr:hypothetical protein PHYPSEUDO_011454 [Phytophthora pseudosyringae]